MSDAPLELSFDDTPDPCESPLLDDGSDGIVTGRPLDVLGRLAFYQEEGHSYNRIRRDFALSALGDQAISNGDIDRAAEYARQRGTGNYRARRFFGGVDLPKG